MASKTITLKNAKLDVFGPSPSNKWGALAWTASGVGPGNGTWGMKSAAVGGYQPIIKSLFRTWSKTNSIIATQATALFPVSPNHIFSKSIQVLYSNIEKALVSGNGYIYVFPGPVTNIVNEAQNTFTEETAPPAVFSLTTYPNTTWSEE